MRLKKKTVLLIKNRNMSLSNNSILRAIWLGSWTWYKELASTLFIRGPQRQKFELTM